MKKIPGFSLLFVIAIVLIFGQWLKTREIIGGDWPYFFNETLSEFSLFPPAWSALHGNGLGGMIPAYFLDQYLYFTAFFTNTLNIPWSIIYKIFWFGLFIALSISSSIYLLKTIFSQAKLWQMGLAALIFTTNTYILMVVGGGQMGIALAYSIAPLILARFIKIIHNSEFIIQNSIIAGLVLGVQIMFDPRIAYITMIAVVIYYLLSLIKSFNTFYLLLYIFAIPIGIAGLLNAYWLFPLIATRQSPLPEGFTSFEGFKFFSFADFSHALSLLHPNWPENIFGKTYFLKPEFLLLPIIAYSSLLFISKTKDQRPKTILSFALLGLTGAFLAKGVNEPFGEINQWLFQYIPGMNMFRDPTKWYMLVAISYSVLIPFSIWKIYELLKSYNKFSIFNFQNLFLILTTLYLILLIRPDLLGQLGGTFAKREIPKEYIELKDFLYSQPNFFRTLWIPRQQRFAFVSNIHPAVEGVPLFDATNSAQIVEILEGENRKKLFSDLAIKYVIVPYDPFGEIFIEDRKYAEKQHQETIRRLEQVSWLKRINGFGKIVVFEVPNPEDHFWVEGEGKVTYEMLSPTTYDLDIEISQPTKLVFSENFSSHWTAKTGNSNILSKNYKGINSFDLNKTGHNRVRVFFSQEKVYIFGRAITLITFFMLAMLLIRTRRNFIFKN